ncbi:MAG: hypothetical protein GX893_01825 [Firmicutes bacterium]|nr:hypothetical protein [Bacillota bacterium]
MRKPLTLLLVLILLLLTAEPGFAAEYYQTAVEYLAKKYEVPTDRVQVHEGDKITLEYLQESFWCAKYEILSDGQTPVASPQSPGTIEPVPPQVMPLPEPILEEEPPEAKHEIDPDSSVSSLPRYDTGGSASSNTGIIYIREKTAEILDDAGMEAYFLRERELAATAWEKLRQEAGKVEVNFYKRLQEADAQTKFSVRIVPTFTETAELTQRFKELKSRYPEYSRGISSLKELFGSTAYGVTGLEAVADVAILPSAAAADTPLVQGEAEGAGSMPAYGGDSAGEPVRDLPVIEEDYEAYYKELEAIRLTGLEASARIITDKLSALGISHTYENGVVAAELTKAQINELVDLDAVQLISDDQYYAMETGRSLGNAVTQTADDLEGAASAALPISKKNIYHPIYCFLPSHFLQAFTGCAVFSSQVKRTLKIKKHSAHIALCF